MPRGPTKDKKDSLLKGRSDPNYLVMRVRSDFGNCTLWPLGNIVTAVATAHPSVKDHNKSSSLVQVDSV